MTQLKSLTLLGAILFLTGCLVNTPDGTLDPEYIEIAKAYEGNYSGTFGETVAGQLTFEILGGDRPVLTFSGKNDVGLLGSTCGARIGQLRSFHVSKKKATIKFARFDLDHNCQIEGRSIVVAPQEDESLAVRVNVQSFRNPRPCLDRAIPIPTSSTGADLALVMDVKTQSGFSRIPQPPMMNTYFQYHRGRFQ